jgi:hypothetical protein
VSFGSDFTDTVGGAAGFELFMAGSNLYGSPNVIGQATSVIKAQTWLDYHPPAYLREVMRWAYARDHYTGECASLRKITQYLIRKGIGETLEAYQERVALADYTPHFAHIVDSLAGMLFGIEVDADRDWGALGDETKPETPAGKLSVDADGDRNGYKTVWKVLTTELIAIHDAWLFVDGGEDPKHPRIRIIPAEAVTNWRFENGVLVEAIIREIADKRDSLRDDPKKTGVQFLYMDVDGWQRYEKQAASKDPAAAVQQQGDATQPQREIVVEVGPPGSWSYVNIAGASTIPLIPVSLPLRRHVGYMLARKANSIFNKESERDALLRHCSFPLLNIVASDNQYKKIVDMLKKGARALQVLPGVNQHAFIAPSPAPAQMLESALTQKIHDIYITGFREYGGAGQRSQGNAKTATETRIDVATGIAAFLQMTKSAIDDGENAVLYFLEQTLFPNDKSKWGQARVKRSDDFVPFDMNEMLERIRGRYFGANVAVPVGRTARIQAAVQIAKGDGLDVDEQEIAADVDMAALSTALQAVTLLDPSMPPEAKGEMVIRVLASLGYVNPDEKVVNPDGSVSDELLADDLRKKAAALATKVSAAQTAPPPAPGGGPPGKSGGIKAIPRIKRVASGNKPVPAGVK